MRYLSLKTKLVICSLALFFVFVPATAYFSLNYFKEHYQQSIENAEKAMVSQVAVEIDSKMLMARAALERVASVVTTDIIASPAVAERFLDNRPGTLTIFDNGLFLFTPTGKIIAETLTKPSRTGFDLSQRDYIKQTRDTKRPCISAPFISSQSHKHPIIMFTAPVMDKDGQLLAILGGSLDLLKPNFLGAISDEKIGETGYFSLVTTGGMIVVHHDRSRIMAEALKGADSLYQKAMADREGSVRVRNVKGEEVLSTFRRLTTTDWYVAANYPVSEAFLPVRKATLTAWIIVACGAFVMTFAFWLVMGYLITPLEEMTRQVTIKGALRGEAQRIDISTNDEIGELASVFNGLMAEIAQDYEKLEQRVAERTVELQTAVHELESFSYSVAHDLRAPARNLHGLCNVLLEDHGSSLDPEGIRLLQRIARASRNMGDLIDDLLNLARVSRHEMHIAPVDLSTMAREIADELSKNAEGREVHFVIADGLSLQGDAGLFRIVMENLLENAWKFTGSTEKAVIEFGATSRDGKRVLYVRDNGAGFNMEYAGNLFVPFQRLHRVDEFQGTGIGLATVQRIIQRHGGIIWGEGEEGKGAVFYFSLP